MTTLGEHREGYIFEGEHCRSFSYDLGWLCYCAGWRQSPPLEELSLIRICLLEDHLKNCILSLLRCRACDLHIQFRWAARFFTMFWKENTKIFFPSCTPRVRVPVQVSDWQPAAWEPSFCLWAVNSRSFHGLSCQFWKDLGCRSFFSILDCPFCMSVWAQVVD